MWLWGGQQGLPHWEGWDASSSILCQGPTYENSQELPRRLPVLDAGIASPLFTMRWKPGPSLLLLCFGSLPLGFLFYSTHRQKSLSLQGAKRDDASALALQGGGKAIPVFLG